MPERTNTYAAPVWLLWPNAPTTTVGPEMATEVPKRSNEKPSEAVSSACWDQAAPERTNTYAAPVCEFLKEAPTTAMDPEMATETPKPSSGAPSEAVSFACWKALPAAAGARTVLRTTARSPAGAWARLILAPGTVRTSGRRRWGGAVDADAPPGTVPRIAIAVPSASARQGNSRLPKDSFIQPVPS